jgi:hypothetical protein
VTVNLLVLTLLLAGPAAGDTPAPSTPAQEAPDSWPSLLGSGLFTLQDTATLPPGRFLLSFTVDNKDRDPLGLDLVDGALTMNVGVTRRSEIYARYVFSRGVAVPDTPVLPPPPLDFILPPGAALPQRPYYSLYSPVPYVDDSGPERFGSDISGDALLGVKVRALEPRVWRPGIAASFEVNLPLHKELYYLKSGSGTGGVDLRLGSVAEWRRNKVSAVASLGFTRVGTPAYPDRLIQWRDGHASFTEEPLVLPHRLDAGLGLRRVLRRDLAAVAEVNTVFETGHRTRSLDRARPIDLLAGLQYRWKSLRVVAAVRHHGNALRSMKIQKTPLAGFVDMSQVTIEDLTGYLGRLGGLDDGAPLLRPGAHRLLSPPPVNAPELPPGARVIPDSYRIRSEHQYGFLMLFGLRF